MTSLRVYLPCWFDSPRLHFRERPEDKFVETNTKSASSSKFISRSHPNSLPRGDGTSERNAESGGDEPEPALRTGLICPGDPGDAHAGLAEDK